MKGVNANQKGPKIIAKIDAKLAKEQGTTKSERYDPHDDWTWNDH